MATGFGWRWTQESDRGDDAPGEARGAEDMRCGHEPSKEVGEDMDTTFHEPRLVTCALESVFLHLRGA